jgi:hypothetical protein
LIATAILVVFFFFSIKRGDADVVKVVIANVSVPKTLEEKILDVLPKIFIKIGKAESELNPKAVNWNCWYFMPTNTDPTRKVSRPCLPGDRPKAWSVDCGLFQINIKGNECPQSLFDIDINISKAKAKYDTEGLGAWDASLAIWTNS